MNSIGVYGSVSSRAAPPASRSGSTRRGQPLARGPVADLVVRLQRDDEPPRVGRGPVDRAAVRAAAERGPPAVVEEAVLEGVRGGGAGAEVGVVALRLAGEQPVQRVVDVVVPLRVRPRPPALASGVTVRGSLRSDSATSASGRPSSSAERGTASASSSR